MRRSTAAGAEGRDQGAERGPGAAGREAGTASTGGEVPGADRATERGEAGDCDVILCSSLK